MYVQCTTTIKQTIHEATFVVRQSRATKVASCMLKNCAVASRVQLVARNRQAVYSWATCRIIACYRLYATYTGDLVALSQAKSCKQQVAPCMARFTLILLSLLLLIYMYYYYYLYMYYYYYYTCTTTIIIHVP